MYTTIEWMSREEWPWCLVVFSSIPVLVGAFIINLKWLQIILAPKVYLLEYASTLLK